MALKSNRSKPMYILILILNGIPAYMGTYGSIGGCVGADHELTAALMAENPANKISTRCLQTTI